jgi:conjugative transfer protein TrbH
MTQRHNAAAQRILLTLLVTWVGCAVTPHYGTFLQGHEQAQYAIATDAASKLSSTYPPESHSIRLERQVDDLFGERLAAELRKQGYSLQERAVHGGEDGMLVRYVLDTLKGTELLRLSIYVPGRRLSRPYAQRSDQVLPNGPWCVEVQDD